MSWRRGLAVILCGLLACAQVTLLRADEGRSLAGEASPDVQDIVFLGPTRPVLLRLRITIDGQPFRNHWRQRFEEVFEQEDRDGDGRLDAAEALRVARAMNGGTADPPSELEKLFAGEALDRETVAAKVREAFPEFVLRPRAVIGQGSALALFPLLDTDGDRRLTAAELEAAEFQLLQRDFDDNGVLTPGELILDPTAIAAASDPNAGEKALNADDSPILLVDESLTPARFAERLLKHYDRDGNGQLAIEGVKLEIQLPAAAQSQWDSDGDRMLSRGELEQAELWPADLDLEFALGSADARARRSRRAARNPDGFTARRKLIGGYDLDLGEAEIDFDRNNRDPRQADLVRMQDYDRDGNAYVDLAEAGASGIGRAAFTAMDIDGDGKVMKGELTSFMTGQNEAAAARLYLVVRDKGQDLFEVLETETDGLLSPRELRSAKSVLDIHDTNGDGVLGGDEVPARLELELVRGVDEQTTADTFVRYSTLAGGGESGQSGPVWFGKMDRNRDGDLSPREFIGPRAAFDRLDANGDGLIDRDEAAAAGK